MNAESLDTSYLARPDGAGPFPGVVVVHEASGLNDNIRDICGRFAREGYAALGVDLFAGRNRAACMARMFAGAMAGNLDYYGVPALKAALGRLAGQPPVDAARVGAIGFCLGGSVAFLAGVEFAIGAVVSFYGGSSSAVKNLGFARSLVQMAPDLRTPYLGIFGDHAHIVGDQDNRGAGRILDFADQVEDLRLDRHIERGGRLVGDQQFRIARQRHRDHRALAHTA